MRSTAVRVRLPLTALFAVLLCAPVALTAQDYHHDIRPLLERSCMGCHSEAGVGFSMEDAEATYERRRAIARAVASRTMPPWLAEAGHQDYQDDPTLSAAELQAVADWAEAGYPKGNPTDRARAPTADMKGPAMAFRPDVRVPVLEGDYVPNQDRADDYRCFLVDWPGERPGYLTGFRAVPGNLRVAHHTVVYAVDPDMAERFRELDEAEEGQGYQCFGGALPDRLGSRAEREAYERAHPGGMRELNRANYWLAHWAPGMDGYQFPDETGIPLEPGTLLVVQMHYYSRHAPGEADRASALDFQLADRVERPAFHLPTTNNRWLVGERTGSMVVAPGERATYEVSDALGDLVPYVSRVTGVPADSIGGLEIHSANLHMHGYGHSGVISLTDGNGRKETLLAVPRWDLDWQRDFTFDAPKVFDRDQLERARLTVECTFENPTDGPVYGGYGSDDEMCFNFSYIAVRRGAVATDSGNR